MEVKEGGQSECDGEDETRVGNEKWAGVFRKNDSL